MHTFSAQKVLNYDSFMYPCWFLLLLYFKLRNVFIIFFQFYPVIEICLWQFLGWLDATSRSEAWSSVRPSRNPKDQHIWPAGCQQVRMTLDKWSRRLVMYSWHWVMHDLPAGSSESFGGMTQGCIMISKEETNHLLTLNQMYWWPTFLCLFGMRWKNWCVWIAWELTNNRKLFNSLNTGKYTISYIKLVTSDLIKFCAVICVWVRQMSFCQLLICPFYQLNYLTSRIAI